VLPAPTSHPPAPPLQGKQQGLLQERTALQLINRMCSSPVPPALHTLGGVAAGRAAVRAVAVLQLGVHVAPEELQRRRAHRASSSGATTIGTTDAIERLDSP